MRSNVSPEQLLRMSENVSPGLPAPDQYPRTVLGSVQATGEGLRCWTADAASQPHLMGTCSRGAHPRLMCVGTQIKSRQKP